ncbi:hypothetical protein ACIBVM_07140 [[Kitasatospora] papulosa]
MRTEVREPRPELRLDAASASRGQTGAAWIKSWDTALLASGM